MLETSFWSAAHRADIAANCLDLFEMVVPRAVEAEIRRPQPGYPNREYPYTTLFRRLRSQMLDPPVHGPLPLTAFGAGEAEAITLAAHLGVALLINDYRAARHAQRMGIQVVTVAQVVVTLRGRGTISDRAAKRKLELIRPITAAPIIAEALRALDVL